MKGWPDTRPNAGQSLQLLPSEASIKIPEKLAVSMLYTDNPQTSLLKVQVFNMAILLLDIASDLWKSVTSLPELFQPSVDCLRYISSLELTSSMSNTLQVLFAFSPS